MIFAALFLSFSVIAMFTHWWLTPVFAMTLQVILWKGNNERMEAELAPTRQALASFLGWILACFVRDAWNGFTPSRFFARLLSIDKIGISHDAMVAKIIVYISIGVVGAMLSLFAAAAVKHARLALRETTRQ